ncbi:MAG TPA: tetratricopeptide repeat protein [Terriglobales bacterium]|nr:tetratricopeptide repeat protein [Terriglobales bacterium]
MATAILFLPALRYPFVYDDIPQVLENPELRTWNSLPGFFVKSLWSEVGAKGGFYRPLFKTWLVVNYQLWGTNVAGWHAANLICHLLAVALAYALVLRLTRARSIAALAALIFGIHPSRIESVVWISGIADPLMSVFLLGGLLAYLEYVETRRGSWLASAALLLVAALLSKETAIVFAAVVMVHSLAFERKREPERRRAATRAVALFFVITVAYLLVRVMVLGALSGRPTELPLSTVLLTAPSLLGFYARQLAAPFRVSLFYDTPYVRSARAAEFVVPLVFLGILVTALWLWARKEKSPAIAFFSALTLLPLLPTLDLRVFQWKELAHDRYLYLPVLGFSVLVALAVRRIGWHREKPEAFSPPARIAIAVVVLTLMASTSIHVRFWRNPLVLYGWASEVAPNNATALNLFARELLAANRKADALAVYSRVVHLAPNWWEVHYNAGVLAYELGRYAEAEVLLGRAIELAPQNAAQFYILGLVRLAANRPRAAEAALRQALERYPSGKDLHEALGKALLAQGRQKEAEEEFAAGRTLAAGDGGPQAAE